MRMVTQAFSGIVSLDLGKNISFPNGHLIECGCEKTRRKIKILTYISPWDAGGFFHHSLGDAVYF
jgi:hypothetical protein